MTIFQKHAMQSYGSYALCTWCSGHYDAGESESMNVPRSTNLSIFEWKSITNVYILIFNLHSLCCFVIVGRHSREYEYTIKCTLRILQMLTVDQGSIAIVVDAAEWENIAIWSPQPRSLHMQHNTLLYWCWCDRGNACWFETDGSHA